MLNILVRYKVLLCLLFLSGCATDKVLEEITKEFVIPSDMQAVVDAAKRAEKDGNYDAAVETYQALLEQDVNNFPARWGLASVYLRQGNIDGAGNGFMEITRSSICIGDSRTIVEETVIGMASDGSGLEVDVSENQANVEVPAKPTAEQRRYCSLAWNGLGVIADVQGHFVMAEEAYKEALSLSKYESAVYNNYGYSLMMAHRYSEAESMLIKGYALAPESVRIRINLALSKAWLGKYKDALETYSYTLRDPEAYNDIGYIALLKNDFTKAIELFEQALEISPVFYKKAAQNLDRAQRLEQEFRSAKKVKPSPEA